MTTIKATCPDCGDVTLTIADVRLEVEETLTESVTCFAFECRACERHVRGEATPEVVRSLSRAGATVRHFRLPAEAREAHSGPVISEDDVIQFGQWLEQTPDPIRALVPA